MTGSAAPGWAAVRAEEGRGDDVDVQLDDPKELARALLVARAKSMHPAGSGRR